MRTPSPAPTTVGHSTASRLRPTPSQRRPSPPRRCRRARPGSAHQGLHRQAAAARAAQPTLRRDVDEERLVRQPQEADSSPWIEMALDLAGVLFGLALDREALLLDPGREAEDHVVVVAGSAPGIDNERRSSRDTTNSHHRSNRLKYFENARASLRSGVVIQRYARMRSVHPRRR